MRAVPADILDDIISFDADKNTASWLGLELRNITVSENPESNQAPYHVTLEADLFDADQGVATLSSTNTFDRMVISITTPDAEFDQTVDRDGSGRLIVASTLTSPAPRNTGTESSLTLTEIVDIDTGEITVQGRASQDEFWEAVAASIGFPGSDGGERALPAGALLFMAGFGIAVVVVVVICVVSWWLFSPWCW